MTVTAEISLYPLKDDYEDTIIGFIKMLRETPNIEVHTHSMSTFVKGNTSDVMNGIANAMEMSGDKGAFSLVLKAINRNLPVEKGFIDLH